VDCFNVLCERIVIDVKLALTLLATQNTQNRNLVKWTKRTFLQNQSP